MVALIGFEAGLPDTEKVIQISVHGSDCGALTASADPHEPAPGNSLVQGK